MAVTDKRDEPARSTEPASDVRWYALEPDEVASRLQVDPLKGLTEADAQQRS